MAEVAGGNLFGFQGDFSCGHFLTKETILQWLLIL